jgi:8-oxo-dGTP diphosphatase
VTRELVRPVVGVQAAVLDHGRVLLGRRSGIFGDGSWGLPGGHLEFGESFEQAASRELLEETDLVATSLRAVGVLNTPYEDTHYIQVCVIVDAWAGVLDNRETTKCSALGFFQFSALPEPIFAPSVEFLQRLASDDFVESDTYTMRLEFSTAVDDEAFFCRLLLVGKRESVSDLPSQLRYAVSEERGRRGRRNRETSFASFPTRESALAHLSRTVTRLLARRYTLIAASGSAGLDEFSQVFPTDSPVELQSVNSRPRLINRDQLRLF